MNPAWCAEDGGGAFVLVVDEGKLHFSYVVRNSPNFTHAKVE